MIRRRGAIPILWAALAFPVLSRGMETDSLFIHTTLPAEDASIYRIRSAFELLTLFPAVRGRDTGFLGQWSSFRLGGSDPSRSSVMLDGLLLDDPWTGIPDLSLIPLDMTDSVDLYTGHNPFGITPAGGLLLARTPDISSNHPVTRILYETGTSHLSDIGVTFGQKFTKTMEFFAGLSLVRFSENEPQEYAGQTLYVKATWQPLSHLTLGYNFYHNQKDLRLPFPVQIPGDTVLTETPCRKVRRFDHLFDSGFTLGRIQSKIRLQYSALSTELRDLDFNPASRFPASFWLLSLEQHHPWAPMPFTLGVVSLWRELNTHESQVLKDNTVNAFLRASRSFWNAFSFLVEVNGHWSAGGCAILPYGQFQWKPGPAFSAGISYGEGARYPSLGEKYGYPLQVMPPVTPAEALAYQAPLSHRAENPVVAERDRTLQGTAHFSALGFLKAGIRGYWTSVRNEILPCMEGDSLFYRNGGNSRYAGASLECSAASHGFSVQCAADYLSALDGAGHTLPERPSFTGRASLSWKGVFFKEDLVFSITSGVLFSSSFWAFSESTAADFIRCGPSTLLYVQAALTVMRHADLYIAVENLLDADVLVLAEYQYPGRTVRTGVRWDLFD